MRSLQSSQCVFKILFLLLQIDNTNSTREHLASVEDKCLQCSRFCLILPSTPCTELKASKIICLKEVLSHKKFYSYFSVASYVGVVENKI